MDLNFTENDFKSENVSSENPLVLATYLLAYKIGKFYFLFNSMSQNSDKIN